MADYGRFIGGKGSSEMFVFGVKDGMLNCDRQRLAAAMRRDPHEAFGFYGQGGLIYAGRSVRLPYSVRLPLRDWSTARAARDAIAADAVTHVVLAKSREVLPMSQHGGVYLRVENEHNL